MLHLLRRQFVLLVGAVCLLAPGFAEAEEKNAEAKDKEAKRKAAAAKAPTYVIHRVKTKIVVDGRADEPTQCVELPAGGINQVWLGSN